MEEQTMQDIEDKINDALKSTSSEEQISEYIRDIYDFGDIFLYKDLSGEEIYFDFVDWSKPDY
jgi:hypothetical protein